MALTKCPECGMEMSDMANACPKCAFPIKSNNVQNIERKNTDHVMFIVCVVVALIVFAFYWYEVRPTQIRQQCYFDSKNSKNKEILYNDCLKENGITRSIFSN